MQIINIDREFKVAAAHLAAPVSEVRMARALFEVGAVLTVEHAFATAARLDVAGILPSQVRRNYPMGGVTHDYIQAVAGDSYA